MKFASSFLLSLVALSGLASVAGKCLTYHNIRVKNKCAADAKIAIHFRDFDGDWHTECWWNYDGGEDSSLAIDGKKIRTDNQIYLYASTKSTEWDGDSNPGGTIKRTCGGKRLHMFPWPNLNSAGDIYVELSCDTRSGNLRVGGNATNLELKVLSPEEIEEEIGMKDATCPSKEGEDADKPCEPLSLPDDDSNEEDYPKILLDPAE